MSPRGQAVGGEGSPANGPADGASGASAAAGGFGAASAIGGPGARRSYHHGDLRNALVDAATELVRAGGPEAIVLREVARATGVSSTAAYRHFENHGDLVEAVKEKAGEMMVEAVRAELTAAPSAEDAVDDVFRRIRASGVGYVRFALAEPGLFRLIFRGKSGEPPTPASLDDVSPLSERDKSYEIMATALDELVALEVLAADRRPYMDVVLWGVVHGMSTLLLETDLNRLPEPVREAAIERMFDLVFHGLRDHPAAPD